LKTYVRFLWLVAIVVLLCSCSTPVSRPPEYTYQKEAITITLKADPQLNLYQGSPHTWNAAVLMGALPMPKGWLCSRARRQENTWIAQRALNT
jgi:hypothetical protein